MFSYLFKKLRFWNLYNENYKKGGSVKKKDEPHFSHDLKNNLKIIKSILGNSYDIIIREFAFGHKSQINGALIFIKGLADKNVINESIIKPLMYDSRLIRIEESIEDDNVNIIRMAMLSVGDVEKVSFINEAIDNCLSGYTIMLVDGSKEALVINTIGFETRSIDEPKTETVVRGPREGFTETLATNITLLRRKIKNPDFTLETIKIGKRTKTSVCIAYLKGITNPSLIEEIRRRLRRINTDAILESGYIEQFIEDAPFSIFSTVSNSEKPDKVAAKILEGRAAILVDGTPFVLVVPMVFIESYQSAEDYYSRFYFTSIIRTLRFLAYLIGVLAPAAYVALTTFHQELIPTRLLLTMAAAHEGVPFPAVVEAGIMIVTFEILREAGVRLPSHVGQAVSIVGALVIGESAVSAGIIGAPMVIVVAITAVASFVVPVQTDSGSVLRYVFLILAGAMGGFGIAIGLLGMIAHLASLRSFGTPYLSPIAPLDVSGLKDTYIRAPLWAMLTRPKDIAWHDEKRQEFRLKPNPPQEKENDSKD